VRVRARGAWSTMVGMAPHIRNAKACRRAGGRVRGRSGGRGRGRGRVRVRGRGRG